MIKQKKENSKLKNKSKYDDIDGSQVRLEVTGEDGKPATQSSAYGYDEQSTLSDSDDEVLQRYQESSTQSRR